MEQTAAVTDKTTQLYKMGDKVTLKYDPKDPSVVYLRLSTDGKGFTGKLGVIGGAAALLTVIGIFVFAKSGGSGIKTNYGGRANGGRSSSQTQQPQQNAGKPRDPFLEVIDQYNHKDQ